MNHNFVVYFYFSILRGQVCCGNMRNMFAAPPRGKRRVGARPGILILITLGIPHQDIPLVRIKAVM